MDDFDCGEALLVLNGQTRSPSFGMPIALKKSPLCLLQLSRLDNWRANNCGIGSIIALIGNLIRNISDSMPRYGLAYSGETGTGLSPSSSSVLSHSSIGILLWQRGCS